MDEAMLFSTANDVAFLKKTQGKLMFTQSASFTQRNVLYTDESCHPLLVGSSIGRHFDLCEQLQYECL